MANTKTITDKMERKKIKRAARKKAAPKAARTTPRGSNKAEGQKGLDPRQVEAVTDTLIGPTVLLPGLMACGRQQVCPRGVRPIAEISCTMSGSHTHDHLTPPGADDAAQANVRHQVDRQADQRLGAPRALLSRKRSALVADCARHRRGHRFGHLHRDRHRHRRGEVRHLLHPECSAARLPRPPLTHCWPPGAGPALALSLVLVAIVCALHRALLRRTGVSMIPIAG